MPEPSNNGVGEDTPTPAGDFRKMREQGTVIALPSTERKVRVRTLKLSTLAKAGKIPDPLSDLMVKLLYGAIPMEEYERFFSRAEQVTQALDMAESLRVVCTAALLYPRIVDDPQDDDEIHIDDLEDGEQRFIFELALVEATGLSRFRQRQAERVAALPPDEADEPTAEPVPGD